MPQQHTTRTADHHVVADPVAGEVVRLPAGSRLEVTFPHRGLASNAWRVEERPGHVVPLGSAAGALHFLVFRPEAAPHPPLRLVRTRGGAVTDVRELTVLVTR
jgi:hypothetical protein